MPSTAAKHTNSFTSCLSSSWVSVIYFRGLETVAADYANGVVLAEGGGVGE